MVTARLRRQFLKGRDTEGFFSPLIAFTVCLQTFIKECVLHEQPILSLILLGWGFLTAQNNPA